MNIELLKPMTFGRGEFKVGDTVDVNHSLARELIRQAAARMPVKKKPKPYRRSPAKAPTSTVGTE